MEDTSLSRQYQGTVCRFFSPRASAFTISRAVRIAEKLALALSCALPTSAIAAQAVAVDASALETCMELGMNEAGLACFRQIAEKAREVRANPDLKLEAVGLAERDRQTHVTRGVILDNMEFSYITAGSGARFAADQTNGNMLYEAQIFKNISWKEWSSEAINTKFWLDVPIRLGVRQLTENSLPVRTPSYNPGIRLYMSQDKVGNENERLTYYSLGLHHYSNGQEGAPATREGIANTRSGSFTTNYAEASAHFYRHQAPIQMARLSLRQHFHGTWEPFQHGQYPKGHVSLELRSPEFFKTFPTQLRLTETLGWGYQYVVKNDVIPSRNVDARNRDRLHTTMELLMRLGQKSNLAFYVRYDYGHDYYNINFQNRTNRFQFGVAAF